MDDLSMLLFRQCNVISRRQALRRFTAAAIKHRLATGRWRTLHRGIYLAGAAGTGDDRLGAEQRRWVASLSAGGGRTMPLGGLSALIVSGLRGFVEREIQVVVPACRKPVDLPHFVAVHRVRNLARGDVVWNAMPPCVGVARSVVDAARWARFDDQSRAIVAASFQQRLVSDDDLDRVLAVMPRVRRRGLIAAAVADARGGVHSLPEVEFVRLCHRAGLPAPACQVRRIDAAGGRRYLDAYFERWRVHVEIDGGHHMDVRQYWADMKRQNDLWVAGDRVLRFPAWAVRNRPDDVVAQVRAALEAAGWC